MFEESIGREKLRYALDSRPPECPSALHLYYKQSLHYKNQCFSLDYLYRIKLLFYSLESLRAEMAIKVQNPLIESMMTLAGEDGKTERPQSLEMRTFTLSEVKEDIYQAVRLKS